MSELNKSDLKNIPEQVPVHGLVDKRVLDEVAKALGGLRYGSVEITVHDGKVTQIEAKRKIRLS